MVYKELQPNLLRIIIDVICSQQTSSSLPIAKAIVAGEGATEFKLLCVICSYLLKYYLCVVAQLHQFVRSPLQLLGTKVDTLYALSSIQL